MRLVFVLSVLAALALAPAAAQSPKHPAPPSRPPTAPPPAPGPGAPVPGLPPPPSAAPETTPQTGAMTPAPQHQARSPDQAFVAEALRAGQNETDLASLAEQKAGSQPVREFAQQMARDHGQANSALNRLTEGAPAPGQPDAEHRRIHEALSNVSGPEFDIEYLRLQVQARQRMAQLMEYVIGSGKDVQVQRFASDALPKVFAHLAVAQQLLDQVSMQNPQAAAAPPRKVSGMPTLQTPRATLN